MYPATFFGLFPAFPRNLRVFVAMSFDRAYEARWLNVISRAVNLIEINGQPLEPHRVDFRSAGDSILTEILDGIAQCRTFVADITSIGDIGGRPVRNANVMYEVGLAHAMRQPEEVLLFRSDEHPLMFDISNVRVHRYDPDGSPDSATELVRDKIAQSLREIDLRKNLAVRRIATALDYRSWMTLGKRWASLSSTHNW